MSVRIKDFDEQYNPDEGTDERFPDQGEDNLGGPPTGGSGNTGGSGSGTSTRTNNYYFSIKSNQTDWTLYINDSVRSGQKTVRVLREKLAEESVKIEIKKEGYFCNTYYVVEMVDDGTPVIKNEKASDELLGISTKDITITKYVGGEEVGLPKTITDITSNELEFTLRKNSGGGDEYEEPSSYKVEFNISGEGAPVSILKNGNKNAQFFPEVGTTNYEDVDGTKYIISSADTSLYRISEITIVKPNNKPVILNAEEGETLETTLTLNSNYTISIITEKLEAPLDGLDPRISLVNEDPRRYNINDKSGVPLLIQKNEDVQAITIIVGDDILEFDDLDDDDVIGLTIPHNVFEKIGQYKIKLFPFSFDDYETQIREEEEPITITPKEVTPKFVEKEVEKPNPPKPEDKVNPYKPTGGSPRRGGGGGGGRNEFIEREEFNDFGDRFDDFGRNDRPNYDIRQF